MEKKHAFWYQEEQRSIEGWDFSHLDGRWESDPLPWDYTELVKQYLQASDTLLDLGTGGGELLLTLKHPYELTSVTEGYPPNYERCLKTLCPLGITVKPIDDTNHLDFPDQSFDIVIDRHEAYDLSEVMRVLKSGGYFVTQQCGGLNNVDLSRRFIPDFISEYADFNYLTEVATFRKAGFEIIHHEEYLPKLRFYDVGAIVFYAKNIPWEFPGFSVERYLPQLDEMQSLIEKERYIESTESRFLIIARKPVH
ncbi:MAG: methyltransferase domain-containing protein [Erysipelotrichaceae bacterium]